ncbi:ABC-type Zn2+ transport system substrate-binding protein/surface adhesin [Luteibacter sp. HA06]|jgi:hypothetical protein
MKRLLIIAMLLSSVASLSGCIIRDHRDGGYDHDRYNNGPDHHCDDRDHRDNSCNDHDHH